MSHFSVLVIVGTAPLAEAPDRIAAMLAPYDENITVEPYREVVAEDSRRFYDADELTIDGDTAYRMSTYNPKSKWDWYSIGGRWTGLLPLKDPAAAAIVGEPGLMTPRAADGTADIAYAADVRLDDLAGQVFAMLTPEGWEAPAEMGWFGMERERSEDEASWRDRVAKTLAALDPRAVIAIVDCHI